MAMRKVNAKILLASCVFACSGQSSDGDKAGGPAIVSQGHSSQLDAAVLQCCTFLQRNASNRARGTQKAARYVRHI